MVQKITEGICVQVETCYKGLFMGTKGPVHVFGYKISIANQTDFRVQLVSRKWTIIDTKDSTECVIGDGVIGEQPIIAPDDAFTYESFCHLNSTVGAMKGHYTMQRMTDRESFRVDIPTFQLFAPFKRN